QEKIAQEKRLRADALQIPGSALCAGGLLRRSCDMSGGETGESKAQGRGKCGAKTQRAAHNLKSRVSPRPLDQLMTARPCHNSRQAATTLIRAFTVVVCRRISGPHRPRSGGSHGGRRRARRCKLRET